MKVLHLKEENEFIKKKNGKKRILNRDRHNSFFVLNDVRPSIFDEFLNDEFMNVT